MKRYMSTRWVLPFLAAGVVAVAACDDDDPVGPDTGTLTVTVTAAGAPADPDGFQLTADGVNFGAVVPAAGGTVTDDVEPGVYELELTGVAANCTVVGENPRDVTVTEDETTTATFAVTCAAETGSVEVTTTTTGTNPDADGYMVTVGTGTPMAIGSNATLTIDDVTIGDVDVLLTGIQGNCAVTGDNPVTATVALNLTDPVAFAVACAAATGSAEVTTATTGTNLDADGYTITVDGGAPINVGVNETIIVPSLGEGDRAFQLGGVAANCTVTGGVDQTITIVDQQTATVDYTITCT